MPGAKPQLAAKSVSIELEYGLKILKTNGIGKPELRIRLLEDIVNLEVALNVDRRASHKSKRILETKDFSLSHRIYFDLSIDWLLRLVIADHAPNTLYLVRISNHCVTNLG